MPSTEQFGRLEQLLIMSYALETKPAVSLHTYSGFQTKIGNQKPNQKSAPEKSPTKQLVITGFYL